MMISLCTLRRARTASSAPSSRSWRGSLRRSSSDISGYASRVGAVRMYSTCQRVRGTVDVRLAEVEECCLPQRKACLPVMG